MPYCSNCGAKADGKFCSNCGAPMNSPTASDPGYRPVGAQPKEVPSSRPDPGHRPVGERPKEVPSSPPDYGYRPVGEQPKGDAPSTPSYGFTQKSKPATGAAYGANPQDYKLGWHKFLIYFILWLSALISIGSGGFILISVQEVAMYGVSQFAVFCALGGICGIIYIVLGVMLIYVRFQLAKFKRGAPKKLALTYGIGAAASILAIIATASVSISLVDVDSFSSVAWSLVWMFFSWRYYSSREELFVN